MMITEDDITYLDPRSRINRIKSLKKTIKQMELVLPIIPDQQQVKDKINMFKKELKSLEEK